MVSPFLSRGNDNVIHVIPEPPGPPLKAAFFAGPSAMIASDRVFGGLLDGRTVDDCHGGVSPSAPGASPEFHPNHKPSLLSAPCSLTRPAATAGKI